MATLNHLLSEVPAPWKYAVQILKNSFYIDNSLTSLDSIPNTEKSITELHVILALAHFNLRCWRLNLSQAMIDESKR